MSLDQIKVELVNHMGDDLTVVNCARVSYGKENITFEERDTFLLDYLIREKHTTPVESVKFMFRIHVPIFIARQLMRSRTGSFNEISGRYVELTDSVFEFEDLFEVPINNKQGRSESKHSLSEFFKNLFSKSLKSSYKDYKEAVDAGIAKEQARSILPLATMTQIMWTIDLHNLFHFLKTRLHGTAQAEIRYLAKQIMDLIKPIVPVCLTIFENQVLNAQTFSKRETLAILDFLRASGGEAVEMILARMPDKREQRILKDKLENYTKHLIDIGD